jgi:hypothetical protein
LRGADSPQSIKVNSFNIRTEVPIMLFGSMEVENSNDPKEPSDDNIPAGAVIWRQPGHRPEPDLPARQLSSGKTLPGRLSAKWPETARLPPRQSREHCTYSQSAGVLPPREMRGNPARG